MTRLSPRFRTHAWAIVLFVLAIIPRTLALNRYVTPDEPNWVYRTLNFSAALARGDWAGTAQAGHPGVTTMWLGALGIGIQRAIEPERATEAIAWLSKLDRLSPENAEAFKRIGVLIDWARLPVVVVNALGVVGVFVLARRLLGQPTALLAALLLALDPFTAGLGGLLHVDGLLATFVTLSLLALLLAISNQQSAISWLALSGLFAALATLSKSPAIFLIPFALLSLFVAALARHITFRATLAGFLVFLILHSAFFSALYPAMWSDPSAALDVMFERAAHHASDATRPTFFDGQAELNHGLGFYPVAMAYRLSPLVIVGVTLAVAYLIVRVRRSYASVDAQLDTTQLGGRFKEVNATNHQRINESAGFRAFVICVLIFFAGAFIIFLSPAAKKFDRYLLPAIPPLIIVAAWGLIQHSNHPTNHPTNPAERGASSHPGSQAAGRQVNRYASSQLARFAPQAIIVLQLLFLLGVVPYPLMAYNPLLGGAAGARDRIAVGWGEGFGAAAAWVAWHDPGATLAAGGLSDAAPLYAGRTVTLDAAGLAAADYIVFTVSEMQLAPEFFRSLAARGELAQAINMAGIETAWVYRATAPAQQAEWIGLRLRADDAIVVDAATPLARRLPSNGVSVLPPDATPESISAALDALRHRPRIAHVSTEASSPVVRRAVRDWLTANARLLEEASASGATLRIYQPTNQPTNQPTPSLSPFAVQFDGTLALIGLEPSMESAAYPDRIAVAARWRVLNPPATNYSVTLELTDAAGDAWTRFGGPLRDGRDFAPIHWQPGDVAEQVFSIQVPPELPPGAYRLRFSIDTPDGNRVALVGASGAFSGTAPLLAGLRIDRAPPSFEPDRLAPRERVEHDWPDRVKLTGLDLLTYVVATGDQFLATLHWRSLRDELDPATELQWSLTPETASGNSDTYEWRTPIVPNTTAPLFAGDLVSARYAVRLPLDLPDGRYRLKLSIDGETFDVAPIDVWHRERAFDVPGDGALAGSIASFDVYLPEPLPQQAQAGDALEVKLALRAREEVNVNYTLFVHVIGPNGGVVAQVDTWPQGGLWPMANWVRGQVVEDAFTLTLPADAAPGVYQVVAGMYDALNGSRLPAVDAEGHTVSEGRVILGAPVQVTGP